MRGLELIEKKRRYQRLRKTCWTLFIAAVCIVVLAFVVMYQFSKGPRPGERLIVREVPGIFAAPGDLERVSLTLAADLIDSQPPAEGRPLDIMLGIDNSVSMTIEDGSEETPLERVVRVAKGFVEATDLRRHQIGLVTLDSQAEMIHPLSQNSEPLSRALDELGEGTSTRIHEGMNVMGRELRSNRHRADALSVAIVLSDGRSNAQAAADAAARFKAEGTSFIAPIGIGDVVDDQLLTSLASFPELYGQGLDVPELTAVYQKLIADLEQIVALDLRLTEHTNKGAYDLSRDELQTSGAWGSPDIDGEELVWKRPYLTARSDEDLVVSYPIVPRGMGWPFVDRPGAILAYTPIGSSPTTENLHRKPRQIILPWWFWFLLALLLFLLLLPWLIAWIKRMIAARGPALLPDPYPVPDPFPYPAALPALDLEKLVKQTRPTLIVGLGGTGRWVLTYLKKAVLETSYGRIPKTLGFLLIDTHERENKEAPVRLGNVFLEPEECLILNEGDNPRDIIARLRKSGDSSQQTLADWWPVDAHRNLPDEQYRVSLGTNARRVFGKLGLFLDAEKGADQSRFWSRISAELGQLWKDAEGDGISVFLAGSLCGGTGSGMLVDSAHLIRQIASENQITRITLHALVALQNSFATRVDGLGTTRANTFAALREIDRLLLHRDRDLPMRYVGRDDDPIDGTLQSPVFDGCYVFDAERSRFTLIREAPEKGVFPSMADTVHALLYAPASGDLEQEIKQRKVVQEIEKGSGGHGVVGSFGTFVVRLPVYEFLQAFKYRFSRDFLVRYFDAVEQVNGNWQPGFVAPDVRQRAEEPTRDFLAREGAERSPVDVLQAVAEQDPEMLMVIIEEDRAYKQPRAYADQHHDNFRAYLAQHSMTWLNRSSDAIERGERDPWFSHGYAMLTHLEERLETMSRQTEDASYGIGDHEIRNLADELVNQYLAIVREVRTELDVHVEMLICYRAEETGKHDDKPLADLLGKGEQSQLAIRHEEKALLVRQYLYDDALEEQLYHQFLGEEIVGSNLHRFVWRMATTDGRLTPTLDLVTDRPRPIEPGQRDPNMARLLELPELLAQPIWEMDITPYLAKAYPDPEMLAREILEKASPLIAFDRNRARRHSTRSFLHLPESEYVTSVLEHLYPEYTRRQDVTRAETRDAHSFSAVSILDSLPLDSLEPYRQAHEDYLAVPDENRHALHVFRADQISVLLEMSLPLIHEPKRYFHPRFVALMASHELIRLFARCAVFGLVDGFPGLSRVAYTLALPVAGGDIRHVRLNRLPEAIQGGSDLPLLNALEQFVSGSSVDRPTLDIDFDLLADHLDRAEIDIERLRVTEKSIDDVTSDLPAGDIQKDVLSFIHLVLIEIIEEKEHRNELASRGELT